EACGTPLLRNAVFCIGCGEKLSGRQKMGHDERCPHCGERQPERRRHCIFCGGKVLSSQGEPG
ncbi:MAG: zinc ribbon domain-containing protein, partial [bacterium]